MTTRFERVLKICDEINRGRYPTVDKLCHEFEVSQRTLYGDISLIRQLGIQVKHDKFKGGYFNLEPKKSLPQFDLDQGEVFALTLGKDMLSCYTGTSFEPILRGAIEKICKRLPDRVQVDPDDIICMVKFNPGAVVEISRKMFLDLNRACEKNIPVDLTYYAVSKDEITQRPVEPYRLIEHRGTWYVVAYCRLRKDFRYFALHRIKDYRLRDERFQPREDVDIDKYIKSAFQLEHGDGEHTVKVHFSPQAARYIRERKWHPTQKCTAHKGGACTLEFVTQSLEEAKRWILTFGSDAEVLEPAALRYLISADLTGAAAKYSR